MQQQPRESMRHLPAALQPLLTWVTGVPLRATAPRWRWTSLQAAFLGMTQIAIGMGLGAYAMDGLRWYSAPLLLLSWLTTSGGMRRLDVIIIHQSLHGMLSRRRWVNQAVGEILSVVLLRSPYDDNRREHLLHHAYPCSLRDGDTRYLADTGMRPGMRRSEFHRYILGALVSARHHGGFLWNRLRGNIGFEQPGYRKVMVLVYWVGLAAGLSWAGRLAWFAVLWLPALTFFFQNATFLYTHTEHRWWVHGHKEKLQRHERDQLTFRRFCGDAVPQTAGTSRIRSAYLWTVWWARVFLVHIPYRLFILVGDTAQHDLHHVRPRCDWANSAHERRCDLDKGSERYSEVWGTLVDHLYAAGGVKEPSP